MSKDKSGSPPCGIYVRIVDYADMQKTITDLRQLAMVINRASGYEKNAHVIELVFRDGHAEQIIDLITIIQAQGLIAIVSGITPSQAEEFAQADGVLAKDAQDLDGFRTALPDENIIGVKGAEHAGCGADYIVASADPAVIMKLAATQDEALICAAGLGITNDHVAALALAGASFVEVSQYIWKHPKGVMQGVVNILHALDLAYESEKVLKN